MVQDHLKQPWDIPLVVVGPYGLILGKNDKWTWSIVTHKLCFIFYGPKITLENLSVRMRIYYF